MEGDTNAKGESLMFRPQRFAAGKLSVQTLKHLGAVADNTASSVLDRRPHREQITVAPV